MLVLSFTSECYYWYGHGHVGIYSYMTMTMTKPCIPLLAKKLGTETIKDCQVLRSKLKVPVTSYIDPSITDNNTLPALHTTHEHCERCVRQGDKRLIIKKAQP